MEKTILEGRVFQMAILVAGFCAQSEPPVDFVRDILPLFTSRCISCHGPEKQKGQLRLDSRTSAFRDDLIIPGRAEESRLRIARHG